MNNTPAKNNFVIYLASAVAAAVTLIYSKAVQGAVREALLMCANNIIPSLFVFSCVSLILISSPYSDNIFTQKLSKLLGFYGNCGACVFFGLFAGFPTAAVGAADLLEKAEISNKDCEKIVCFASNAGFAFILGSIGTMFSDACFAKILCLSQTAASLTMLLFFKEKRKDSQIKEVRLGSSVQINLTQAISHAALTMLKVSAFVCFFTVVRVLLLDGMSKISDNPTCKAIVSAFIELGNAAKVCADLPRGGKLICSFAVGFGGISAMLQSISACPKVSLCKYFVSRLAMGALCTGYYAFLSNVINIF